MRALALSAIILLAMPAMAQSDDAATASAPKTKRVCRFVDTGNPMKIERKCHTVALKDATPASAPVAMAAPSAENAQVALAEKPHR